MSDALTDTLTAEKLAAEPEFVALCAVWQKEKHCPLVMPDYLRGLGCERAAMVAVWAVNYVDAYARRLFPEKLNGDRFYFTRISGLLIPATVLPEAPHHLPYHNRRIGNTYEPYQEFSDCIADFLLNADPEALFRLAPPKPEFCVIEL